MPRRKATAPSIAPDAAPVLEPAQGSLSLGDDTAPEPLAPASSRPPIPTPAVLTFTTVTDDGTLLMLPPVGDAVRAALVKLLPLVGLAGPEQVTGLVITALSHVAAALEQMTRERAGGAPDGPDAPGMSQEMLAENLRRVTFGFIEDASKAPAGTPEHTEWRAGAGIVTFVEDDSVPAGRTRRGILAALGADRIVWPPLPSGDAPAGRVLTFSDTRHVAETPAPPISESPAARGQLSPRTLPLPPVLRFKNDNINRAAVRAFSIVSTWQRTGGLPYGVTQEYQGLQIAVGLPESEFTARVWASLSRGGARMVKAHYALWARWYEEGGEPGDYVTVNVSQFCADIGYTKHHKGGFRREHKQEAMNLLEALTSVVISAEYKAPGTNEAKRLRGPLWARGLIGEQATTDGATPTVTAAGTPAPPSWEAVAFSFAPGPWFTHPSWARNNQFIGKIGVGLLQLDNRAEWAILIGGYLGTLMRTNAYRTLRLRANTILQRTGLGQGADAVRRAAENLAKFEEALDQLVGVGVIVGWTWPDIDTAELTDIDDPDAIAAYYAEDNLPKGDWRGRVVEIDLPFEDEQKRLTDARAKRRGRPTTARPREARQVS